MSLLLGMVAGLAYGLSVFAGAFLALPLLVIGAGIVLHASLPVALLALGICAAIAAGDAVRARQVNVVLAGLLLAGGVPVALVTGWLAQTIPVTVLATLFLIAAIVFGPLLLHTLARFRHFARPPVPAALLRAPRRALADVSRQPGHSNRTRLRIALVGIGCGLFAGLCAAPGTLLGWAELDRELQDEPYQVAGTLAFAVAVLAVLAAGFQFLLAPAAPGYTAGLYVLGAVAGMGLARRIEPWPAFRASNSVIGAIVIIAAIALWVAVVTGSRSHI